MSTPNPQAGLAAAQPDAQPAIYETDIWNPPPDGGRLRLFKPMPAPEPLPEPQPEPEHRTMTATESQAAADLALDRPGLRAPASGPG